MVKHLLRTSIFVFLTTSLSAQLSGTYLVDPNGGADYSSLSAAAAALNSQGMGGSVTLKLATALYAEQVHFDIPGQTASQMLTIESQSGNEEDVVFRFEEATDDSTNYQLGFEAIKALTIQNISINTSGLSYGVGISFSGYCSNITIDNLHHDGNRNDVGIVGYYLFDIWEPTYPVRNVTVRNSYFHEASWGINFGYGIYGEPEDGFGGDMHFSDNTFFDSNGIFVGASENVIIANNVFYGDEYEVDPLDMQVCTGNVQIINNQIWHSNFDAFKIQLCEGTPEMPILVANNFISGSGSLVYLVQNSNLLFAHNSVYGDTDNNSPFITNYANTDSRFTNNIFYQNNPEGSIFYGTLEDDLISDYNCMYSNGSYAFGGVTSEGEIILLDFDEYNTQTGQDAHSISVQPIFTIPGEDLHTSNEALNAGTPLTEVTFDIDGETRSTVNPSIGADEIDGVVIVTDLTIDTVTTSGDLNAGAELTISWNGANTGATLFQSPWIDRIYLSDDNQLDNSDLSIFDFEITTNLNAGEAYSHQKILELPLNLFGTKYVIVKVDANATLVEDGSNNIAVSEPIFVTPPPLPNLVVTDITLPDNVFSGTQLQLEYTITNQGDAPASGNWKDIIWQEDFLIFLQDSRHHHHQTKDPWGSRNNPVGLMPGESYIGTFTIETPYIYQGYSYIRIETDGYDNIIEELDANNNFVDGMVDSVFINQSPLADLVIEDIQVPSESFAGEEITISYKVKNNGTETTSPVELPYNFYFGWTWGALFGDWVDYTYFSDSTFSFTPSQYKRVATRDGNLEVDSTYVIQQTFQLPECEHGFYFVTIYADRWNHVAELDEENNAAISDTIHIISRPGPDLIPTSYAPISDLASNSTFSLSYHIENQGADTAFANWRDRVFISDSATFQFDINEMVNDTNRIENLLVGDGVDYDIVINIPPDQYGQKYIYLWIDAANEVCEQPYDNNNILQIPVEIEQSPAADLQIAYYPPSGPYVAGDPIDLSAIATNIGSVVPNAPEWIDRIFLKSEVSTADSIYTEKYTHTAGLAPDASYAFPNPFTIPLDIQAGFYSIGVETDNDQEVWENGSEENNVVQSDPFQITIDSSRTPDLKPVAVVAQPWNTGAYYSIEISVQNAEAATGIGTWVDELILTDTLGHELASATSIFSGNVDHNQEYTATFQMGIPSGTPENAVFIARIDTSNVIFEYQKTNNRRRFPVEINSGPAPDFAPTSLDIPTQVNAGQEMMLNVLRNNFSSVAVQNKNWIDRVILSQDNVPGEDDITLRSYSFLTENMDTESTTAFTDSIQIPLTLVGNYYVIYFMDANNQVAEGAMESNNYVVSEGPLQILTPAPVDFSSTLMDITITDGNPEYIRYEIKNTSGNAFHGKFYNTWYLSEDPAYAPTDLVLGVYPVADYDTYGHQIDLDPGESSEQFASFIYQPVVEGDYYIIQKIDAFLNVYESDEQNNTITFGPFHINNIPEIFPDITYEKQFGSNPFYSNSEFGLGTGGGGHYAVSQSGLTISPGYDSGFDPRPDRHDYKINIPDEYGMIAHMWENEEANEAFGIGNESQPVYEMYVGENFVPDPLNFDFRFDSPLQADQTVLVPVAGERTDYIKARAPYIPPHFDPMVTPESHYFLRAEFKQFSVFNLSPEKVGNAHNVTLRITGFDLDDDLGLDVALLQGTDTVYAFETYPQNPSELVAYIDMRGHDAGNYQLMVRKRSSGATTIWEESVEVIEDEGALLFTEVHAPAILRTGSDIPISVTYGNDGHSNMYDMLVFVAFFMDDSTTEGLSVDYLGSTYPGYSGNEFISTENNPAEPVDIAVFDDAIIFMAYVPIVHARSRESFVFRVKANVTGTVLTTQSSLGLVQRSPYTFTGRVVDAGESKYADLLGRAIASSQGALEELAKSYCGNVLNADAMSQRLAEQTYEVAKKARGAASTEKNLKDGYKALFDTKASIKDRYKAIKGAIDEHKGLDLTANEDTPFYSELTSVFNCLDSEDEAVNFELTPDPCIYIGSWTRDNVTYKVKVNSKTSNGNCIKPPNIRPKGNKLTKFLRSLDPNEIVGPSGSGPARLVDGKEPFIYTIYFENVSDATAPARKVRIDNPLDTNLRLQSLRVISFGFADTSFQFNNSPFVQRTIDLGSKYQNQQLRIFGGTDPQSGKAIFEFTTLNPETQGIVSGAYDGFLLPNDSSGRGQGFITYMIDPVSDLETGTEIKNKAAIIFDENEIIETNTWSNTISGGELASKVLELPEYSATTFQLEWKNETPEYAPAVKSFDIYMRDIDGKDIWIKWVDGTKSLNKQFTGIPGHTYEFYSRAQSDNEFENVSGTADAHTTIFDFKGTIDDGEPMLFPNPATYQTQLAYRSSGKDIPMKVRMTDIQGKLLFVQEFTTSGGGIQFFEIPVRKLSAGVYVVELYENDSRRGSTKLVMAGYPKQ